MSLLQRYFKYFLSGVDLGSLKRPVSYNHFLDCKDLNLHLITEDVPRSFTSWAASFESELASVKIKIPLLTSNASFLFCSRSFLSGTLKPMVTDKSSSELISADCKHIQDQSDILSILYSLGMPRGECCLSIIYTHRSYHRHCINN